MARTQGGVRCPQCRCWSSPASPRGAAPTPSSVRKSPWVGSAPNPPRKRGKSLGGCMCRAAASVVASSNLSASLATI
eukprot:1090720-Lingulodinium_polyedra.AAC.1